MRAVREFHTTSSIALSDVVRYFAFAGVRSSDGELDSMRIARAMFMDAHNGALIRPLGRAEEPCARCNAYAPLTVVCLVGVILERVEREHQEFDVGTSPVAVIWRIRWSSFSIGSNVAHAAEYFSFEMPESTRRLVRGKTSET